jgi:serine/threonine protein kinase/tetratricopeptide (TPR) repeat protein
LFLAAVDLPAPQRSAFLARSCGEDSGLRAEVEALLARDGRPAVLDRPLGGDRVRQAIRDVQGAPPVLPQQIGGYHILGVLGQGGMGTVYRARQTSPDRLVALKVLSGPVVSASMLRRFEFEARVLARLQHPGIAHIHEAGIVEDAGRRIPFFAMELVDGRPLTEYAQTRDLTLNARLHLLLKVCDAIHHAHQKGIIHRDLKPANILVIENDLEPPTPVGGDVGAPPTLGAPEIPRPRGRGSDALPQFATPKVLDFGVARATDADLRTTTLTTSPGQIVGTLSYMSPEQVAGDPDMIDTRSDIYALGVIACELLTGRLPYDVRGRPIAEAARIIRDTPPLRLGTIDRSLRGDLETIVAKALEKEKERRYASVTDLAADLQHFLRDEPILARPPSAVYRFRKYARRNRGWVAMGACALLALVLGIVGTTWQAVRATNSEGRATQLAARESQARRAAEAEAEKATEIKAFLQDMLTSASQNEGRGARFTVREALDEAAQRIATEFAAFPDVRAELQTTLGEGYRGLGLHAEAEPYLRASLATRRLLVGPQDSTLVQPMWEFALVLRHLGKYEESEALLKEAHAIAVANWGADSQKAAGLLASLGLIRLKLGDREAGERLLEECLALRAAGAADHATMIAAQINLASARKLQSDAPGAERAYREALALIEAPGFREDPPLKTHVLNQLAELVRGQQRYQEAIPLFQQVLERQIHAVGAQTPRVVVTKTRLASCFYELRDKPAGVRLANEARQDLESSKTQTHAAVMACRLLGAFYQRKGDRDVAESLYRRGMLISQSIPPEPEALLTAVDLAELLINDQRDSEADAFLRELVQDAEEGILADHWHLAICRRIWGNCLLRLGRLAEAESQLRSAYDKFVITFGEVHARTQRALADLVQLYERSGQADKAAEFRARLRDSAPDASDSVNPNES